MGQLRNELQSLVCDVLDALPEEVVQRLRRALSAGKIPVHAEGAPSRVQSQRAARNRRVLRFLHEPEVTRRGGGCQCGQQKSSGSVLILMIFF